MEEKWAKFRRGDALNNVELSSMIQETQRAIDYMRDRGPEFGVITRILNLDLSSLESMKFWREQTQKERLMGTHYVLNIASSCTHVWAVDPPSVGFLQNLRVSCEAYNESGAVDGTFIVCDSVPDLISHVSEIFTDFSGNSLGEVSDFLAGEGDVYYADPADLLDFVRDFTRAEDGRLPDIDPKYDLDI